MQEKMINELAYIILGGALLTLGYRIKESSPAWIMNIWGLIMVLRGMGFLPHVVPSWSFLPFVVIGMIFFKASSGWMKPIFFISAALVFTMPVLGEGSVAMGSFSGLLVLVILGGGFVSLSSHKRENPKQSYVPGYVQYKETKPDPRLKTSRRETIEEPDGWDDA